MVILFILLYSLVFLLPFSGSVHLFDWDEIIFAEAAREMNITGDFLTVTINYAPFWEKPPGFIWLQALSMKLFGINEFAARFPNLLCGFLTLLSLYLAGRKVQGERFGMLWALSYGTAILPFFYFRTGIIDPWFNLLIFQGFSFFIFYLHSTGPRKKHLHAGLSAFFLGLAVLTKGPVAVLIFGLSFLVYLVMVRGRIGARLSHVLLFTGVLLLTGGSWFLVAILKGHMQVVQDFISYQAGLFSDDFAGHGGFPGFHFVVLLFGAFPASIFMFGDFTRKREEQLLPRMFKSWMVILLTLVLILFSLVQTKLVHYSSLAWYPVTFLAARAISRWMDRQNGIFRWQRIVLMSMGLFFGVIMLVIPLLARNTGALAEGLPAGRDPFVKGILQSAAGWSVADLLPGVIMLAGSVYAVVRIGRRDLWGVFALSLVTLLFTYSSMLLFVPKVEKMIQRPAITFMKQHAGPGDRVIALGFRSFAPAFYGEWMPGDLPAGLRQDAHQLSRELRPLYVVMKAGRADKYFHLYPELERIGQEGGFVFGVFPERN